MVRVPSNCNLTPVTHKSSPPQVALREQIPRPKPGPIRGTLRERETDQVPAG